MEELESLIVIMIVRVSCANWLDYYMQYMAKTEEFEEKIKSQVAKKSKSSDAVTAGSGSVGVDEEFEDCMLVAGGSPRTCGRP